VRHWQEEVLEISNDAPFDGAGSCKELYAHDCEKRGPTKDHYEAVSLTETGGGFGEKVEAQFPSQHSTKLCGKGESSDSGGGWLWISGLPH